MQFKNSLAWVVGEAMHESGQGVRGNPLYILLHCVVNLKLLPNIAFLEEKKFGTGKKLNCKHTVIP